MVASGDDIEMVCGILNGNVKEGKAEQDGDVEGQRIVSSLTHSSHSL